MKLFSLPLHILAAAQLIMVLTVLWLLMLVVAVFPTHLRSVNISITFVRSCCVVICCCNGHLLYWR